MVKKHVTQSHYKCLDLEGLGTVALYIFFGNNVWITGTVTHRKWPVTTMGQDVQFLLAMAWDFDAQVCWDIHSGND